MNNQFEHSLTWYDNHPEKWYDSVRNFISSKVERSLVEIGINGEEGLTSFQDEGFLMSYEVHHEIANDSGTEMLIVEKLSARFGNKNISVGIRKESDYVEEFVDGIKKTYYTPPYTNIFILIPKECLVGIKFDE